MCVCVCMCASVCLSVCLCFGVGGCACVLCVCVAGCVGVHNCIKRTQLPTHFVVKAKVFHRGVKVILIGLKIGER